MVRTFVTALLALAIGATATGTYAQSDPHANQKDANSHYVVYNTSKEAIGRTDWSNIQLIYYKAGVNTSGKLTYTLTQRHIDMDSNYNNICHFTLEHVYLDNTVYHDRIISFRIWGRTYNVKDIVDNGYLAKMAPSIPCYPQLPTDPLLEMSMTFTYNGTDLVWVRDSLKPGYF